MNPSLLWWRRSAAFVAFRSFLKVTNGGAGFLMIMYDASFFINFVAVFSLICTKQVGSLVCLVCDTIDSLSNGYYQIEKLWFFRASAKS